jgi:hypothetical protein
MIGEAHFPGGGRPCQWRCLSGSDACDRDAAVMSWSAVPWALVVAVAAGRLENSGCMVGVPLCADHWGRRAS